MRHRARIGMLAATLVVAAGIPVLAASPAQAAGYRYWSYWHADTGSWQYSGVGADGWEVHDGSVEGWHFSISPNSRSAAQPRHGAADAFQVICNNTNPAAGSARVALLLDFGVPADYPAGQSPPAEALRGVCVTIPGSSPTGLDVLNTAGVAVRDQGGLVCALAGHPATGCGEVVADPSPTRKPTPTPTRKPPAPPTRAPSAAISTPAGAPPSPSTAGTSAPPGPTSPVPSVAPLPPGANPTGSPTPTAGGPGVSPGAAPSPAGSPGPQDSPTLVAGMPVASDSGNGTPWAAVLVLGLVAILGGGAYWRSRRTP